MKCNKQLKYSNYMAFSYFHCTTVNNSGLSIFSNLISSKSTPFSILSVHQIYFAFLENLHILYERKPADRIKSAGFLISNISAHRNSTASIKYFVINYLLALQSSSYRPNRFKNFCHIFKVFASLASPSSISSV